MHSSLHRFLFPLAQQVVTTLCSNYALEGIFEMHARKESEQNEKDELLRVLVRAIVPTPSSFFFASYIAASAPTFDYANPSSTILFDFISSRIQRLLSDSEEHMTKTGNDVLPYGTSFSNAFCRLVSEDSIFPSLQLITTSKPLLRSFMADFFSRTLHLYPLPNEWITAINSFLTKLAQSFGIRTSYPILDFFLVFYLQRGLVLNFCTHIRPILKLHNPAELLRSITKTADLQIRTWEQLQAFLWDQIVAEMWNSILEIDQNLLENWLSVFQPLHHLAPYHTSLLGVLSHSRLLQWDLLTIWSFFLTRFSYRIQLPTRKFVAKISAEKEHQGLKTLMTTINHFCELVTG